MEMFFRSWTSALASYIEAGAAIVIALAAAEAIVRSLLLFVQRNAVQRSKEALRLRLGRWLSVALELELAADILRTAVTPTWNDLGKLAAIVVIRTVINYFLQQEIDRAIRGGTSADAARAG